MRTQKRSKGILLTVVAVLAALLVLVPFLWVLSTALKPDNELFFISAAPASRGICLE